MSHESGINNVILSNTANSTDKYRDQVKAYIAVENNTRKNVGLCPITMDRYGKFAILDGAYVLPSYTGNGIYKSMIYKRLQAARENGIKYFILHALKS